MNDQRERRCVGVSPKLGFRYTVSVPETRVLVNDRQSVSQGRAAHAAPVKCMVITMHFGDYSTCVTYVTDVESARFLKCMVITMHFGDYSTFVTYVTDVESARGKAESPWHGRG